MTTTTSTDPRQRVRDALRRVIQLTPDRWYEPSLFVFRNRVLDLTGSDARPYVELLLDAWERFGDRLPTGPMSSGAWDVHVAPLVMQWTSSRFLQPEIARWAIGCWGHALGRIVEEERPVMPPRSEPMANLAARLNARVAATGKSAWKGSAWRPVVAGRLATPIRPTVPRAAARSGPAGSRVPSPMARPTARATARRAAPPLSPWIARALGGVLAAMVIGLLVRVALSPRKPTINSTIQLESTTARRAPGAEPAPQVAGRVVPPQLTGGVVIVTTERPGVPSITRTLLPTARDSSQLQIIEPVRRATGEPPRGRDATPPPPTSIVYDEVRLTSGRVLRGRVDVVRTGTIIFRDMRSGLRYELPKDDIDAVVTEFGTIVRFRGEEAPSTTTPRSRDPRATRSAAADPLRRRGVGGRYRVRYDAATAVGSPACTEVWTKAPNAIDVAVVRHVPGADTLSVAFEGGDQFPSTMDPDGYFASTFRIVPDQARTMTALTTRLSGRFTPDGAVSITVNLVFFRRLRDTDVTCNVTVNAAGRREQAER